ncbi:hypothetical protein BDV98DRAFT_222853 [Pterulicium gracile]|uniref:Uncharacterized protein n=1 Tax=Pterulicium gracile TaxID=1884261 RepID=A0A5C3QTV7_9AGAR|nr:hypothetical protein BDV98DRAFT_222853 [Pterula gracilis]
MSLDQVFSCTARSTEGIFTYVRDKWQTCQRSEGYQTRIRRSVSVVIFGVSGSLIWIFGWNVILESVLFLILWVLAVLYVSLPTTVGRQDQDEGPLTPPELRGAVFFFWIGLFFLHGPSVTIHSVLSLVE